MIQAFWRKILVKRIGYQMSNTSDVNTRMQQSAEYAVTVALQKFGYSLDYSENSLATLESLLKLAHEQNNSHGISEEAILKTARVWGSYLGEIIRHKWGGDWVVIGKDINLVINGKGYSPIRQVYQRIKNGQQFDITAYYADIASERMASKKEDEAISSSPALAQSAPLKPEGYKVLSYFVNFWKSGKTEKFITILVLILGLLFCCLSLFLAGRTIISIANGTASPTQPIAVDFESTSTLPITNDSTLVSPNPPLAEITSPEPANTTISTDTSEPTITPTTTSIPTPSITPAPTYTPTPTIPTSTKTPAPSSCTAVILTKGPTLIYTGDNTKMRVFWQWTSNATFQIQWGTDTNYSLGNAEVNPNNSSTHLYGYDIGSLTPGTKYYYQVLTGSQCSGGTFYAAPASDATSLKFISYGDTRTNGDVHNGLAGQVVSLYKSDPAFQTLNIHVGDWVSADSDSAWMSEWFAPAFTDLRTQDANIADIGIRGNHEEAGNYWKQYWPEPFQSGGLYWSLDYGPAHFVLLDSYTDFGAGSVQYNWLKNDLAASTKAWKFVAIHEPGWSADGGHENNVTFQTAIQPLLQQYGVAMVLAGHNHYYARAMVNGIVELTVGGGGAPLYTPASGQPDIVATSESFSFGEFTISGNTLTAKVVDDSDATIDTFTISR
jgi:hypothetical protein